MLKNNFNPYKENMNEFVKILANFSTEYIVFHKDWDDNYIKYMPSTKYYESLINGYSYLKDLNGKDCWNFSETPSLIDIENIWQQSPNPNKFNLEVLFIPNKFGSKQLVVGLGLGSFGIYLTEKNEIYFSFYTTDGYRWTSPIEVCYIQNSTIPLKISIYYDVALNTLQCYINDVSYDIKINPKNNIASLEFKRNNIRIGSDDVNQFIGYIFYVHLQSDQFNFKILPGNSSYMEDRVKNVNITKFRIDNISFIEKIFENNKLMIFRIINATQIITTINEKSAQIKNFIRVNPTCWRIQINSTKPFMLSFAESYDSAWKAKVYKNGELIEITKSIPLYGVINGFWIDQTGLLEIVIEYEPQTWLYYSSVVSLLAFIGCIIYFFIKKILLCGLINFYVQQRLDLPS
jgi:hypothetical protein